MRDPIRVFPGHDPPPDGGGIQVLDEEALEALGVTPPRGLGGAWGWYEGTPYLVREGVSTRKGHHHRERSLEDEKWVQATTEDHRSGKGWEGSQCHPSECHYTPILEVGDLAVLESLPLGSRYAIDVETYSRPGAEDFAIVSLALTSIEDPRQSYVVGDRVLHDTDGKARLTAALRRFALVAHNAKYESRSCEAFLGWDLRESLEGDTMVLARLLRADGPAGLAPLAWKVGMGGHKDEAGEALAKIRRILGSLVRSGQKEVPIRTETQERVTTTGKKQRRKVVVESRPPTRAESIAQIQETWHKRLSRRTKGGDSAVTSYCAQALSPLEDTPPPDTSTPCPVVWMAAATSGLPWGPLAYAYALLPEDILHRYNARDTIATALLYRLFTSQLQPSHRTLLSNHLGAIGWALGKVETWGMAVDIEALDEADDELEKRELEAVEAMASLGLEDPTQNDSVAKYLFETKGYQVLRRSTKTKKPSVDKETLLHLKGADPVIDHLLDFRSCSKLRGTYTTGLRPSIMGDGRIRANLHPAGTETGRLSCSSPNLQTIPGRTEDGRRIKSVFCAPPGCKLVQLDYKTLEVRIAAILSGDPVLREVFERGGDPHRETAEILSESLFGGPFEDASPEEQGRRRKICKGIVFATLYGQGPAALASMTGLSEKEAERAQGMVMGRYVVLKQWIKERQDTAYRKGYCTTWWAGGEGRRRPLPDITHPDSETAGHAERQSYNTPVQGTGSEFCVASVVRIVESIVDGGLAARVIMTVHDSILAEVPDDEVDEFVELARGIMVGWESGGLPLEVDVEVGSNWGNMENHPIKH